MAGEEQSPSVAWPLKALLKKGAGLQQLSVLALSMWEQSLAVSNLGSDMYGAERK